LCVALTVAEDRPHLQLLDEHSNVRAMPAGCPDGPHLAPWDGKGKIRHAPW